MSLGAYLTGAILCLAWMAWLAWTKALLALVMVAPLFAYFAARALLTWSAESGTHFMRKLMGAGKWGGLYYEFANVHLRAAERDDRLVFLEADILQVIGQRKSQAPQFFTERSVCPLNIVKGSIANVVLQDAIQGVHDSIKEGENMAEPLGKSGIFDDMVVNMIDVGEETGELDKMLIKVADNYDDEVDVAVASLTSLLEPMLIHVMGGAVFCIVLALFLPLLKIIEQLTSR